LLFVISVGCGTLNQRGGARAKGIGQFLFLLKKMVNKTNTHKNTVAMNARH
jgi:hypothetical protein